MEPKRIEVTPEMLEKSLRCCAEENPAPAGHEPCEGCYLWQLHLVKGGRVSTGETCFQNLVGEAIACIRRLNDSDTEAAQLEMKNLISSSQLIALGNENAMLKKALELSIETHSVDPKQVERLTRYYIQQAKKKENAL